MSGMKSESLTGVPRVGAGAGGASGKKSAILTGVPFCGFGFSGSGAESGTAGYGGSGMNELQMLHKSRACDDD